MSSKLLFTWNTSHEEPILQKPGISLGNSRSNLKLAHYGIAYVSTKYIIICLSLSSTPQCPHSAHFAATHLKTRSIFFIGCPYKHFIWKRALAYFAPRIKFSASHISSLVFDLQKFQLVNNTALFILVVSILRSISRFHWLHILDNVPLMDCTE